MPIYGTPKKKVKDSVAVKSIYAFLRHFVIMEIEDSEEIIKWKVICGGKLLNLGREICSFDGFSLGTFGSSVRVGYQKSPKKGPVKRASDAFLLTVNGKSLALICVDEDDDPLSHSVGRRMPRIIEGFVNRGFTDEQLVMALNETMINRVNEV